MDKCKFCDTTEKVVSFGNQFVCEECFETEKLRQKAQIEFDSDWDEVDEDEEFWIG